MKSFPVEDTNLLPHRIKNKAADGLVTQKARALTAMVLANSISRRLMATRRKEPGHQQPWYWPIQYRGCWWPGDAMSHCISSLVFDQFSRITAVSETKTLLRPWRPWTSVKQTSVFRSKHSLSSSEKKSFLIRSDFRCWLFNKHDCDACHCN